MIGLETTYIVTFSPTRTSFRVAGAVAAGVSALRTEVIDLTRVATPSVKVPSDTLAVLAFPVYGGQLPPLAVERLQAVRGENTPAVAIVVYGNRHYDKALEQLALLARTQGFRIVAAGTFIGEHSYSTPAYPVAAGRPDAADLQTARDLGHQVAQKLAKGVASEVDVRHIVRPVQPFWPKLRFAWRILRFRRSGQLLPASPVVERQSDCIQCGRCVHLCPSGAIPADAPWQTDASRCIRCCACVKGCPSEIRHYDTPFSAFLTDLFATPKQPKTLL